MEENFALNNELTAKIKNEKDFYDIACRQMKVNDIKKRNIRLAEKEMDKVCDEIYAQLAPTPPNADGDPVKTVSSDWIEMYKNDPNYGVDILYLMELYRNLLFLRKYLRKEDCFMEKGSDGEYLVADETINAMDSCKIDLVRECEDYIDTYLHSFSELHSLLTPPAGYLSPMYFNTYLLGLSEKESEEEK